MENKIVKNVENLVNSQLELEDKIKILLETKKYINKEISKLEKEKKEKIFETYKEKYQNEYSDDYSLELKYEADRRFQGLFSLFSKVNIDDYGEFTGILPSDIKEEYKDTFNECNGYENDVFYIRPYNWDGISYCDCNCGFDDKIENLNIDEYKYGFHAKNCVAWDINFCYKPTNLKIAWYKYPLRDAYFNQELEKEELEAIINHCIKSVLKGSDKEKRV